jgi:signal transduction histidine kinase
MNLGRLSLLWKIWLSTSVALTAVFALTGYFLQMSMQETAANSVRQEVQASSKAYEALWQARTEMLESLAALLSATAATGKTLESRDPEAGKTLLVLWDRATADLEGRSFLILTNPFGRPVISSFPDSAPVDPAALLSKMGDRFPEPAAGYFVQNSVLHQVVIRPLPGASADPRAPSGILLAGFAVNHSVAQQLKQSTGRSEFIFVARGQVFASTLNDQATGTVVRHMIRSGVSGLVSDGAVEYVPLARELIGLEGKAAGQLFILRSFEEAKQSIGQLRRRVFFIWEGAIVLGLLLTYVAAERIIKPVKDLDRAASEVAMQNYDYRVAVDSDDELGRLASTFNKMCESLQAARAELIRRERIATIGRLASSIVHDLRNPLAAIYGGSEMLVDTEPTPEQTRRIAANIYRASRRIMELLDDLMRVTRGKTKQVEQWNAAELVESALAGLKEAAAAQSVRLILDIPPDLELAADRPRLEGVFLNLVQNALDVMPDGGKISISARREDPWVNFEVSDTGPGIAPEIRSQLFQPFISYGKKNGLGLGLALARQTMLDHGGDLWASSEEGKGARFVLRLPGPDRHYGPPAA